ncbi:MAG: biotin--[acetyl-CoA-carboxylase] ligase [Bacteroidales bacterium]|jgi:BirA family biotin operon repressor/biotin-[acetyl-CoA-carboxylase] ligase|nr:biotin--[acetyl-CoA-carboxylase] ligase [Bacteroidales bacterium]
MIIGSKLLFYEDLPSTNTQASRLLKEKVQQEGTVVYTDFQTAGRGQTGNKWESGKGKNLLFSIMLYPDTILPEDQFMISMSVSLGICDFLDSHLEGATIKWPNDNYVKNDKIAGILIENSIMGDKIESCVTGIGLNINQVTFPTEIPNAVSLKKVTGKEYTPDQCLNEVLSRLDFRYRQLLYDDRAMIRSEYVSRLYRLNEWHLFRRKGSIFSGRITDVLSSGKLIIEENTGKMSEFGFREIEYVR